MSLTSQLYLDRPLPNHLLLQYTHHKAAPQEIHFDHQIPLREQVHAYRQAMARTHPALIIFLQMQPLHQNRYQHRTSFHEPYPLHKTEKSKKHLLKHRLQILNKPLRLQQVTPKPNQHNRPHQ